MFKLALNAGHGYETAGKRCMKKIDPKETREYVLNKRICDKIENLLSKYEGIKILRIDDGSDIAVASRAAAANKFNADLYLSIHHNAGINGKSGGGIEAYVYLKVDALTLSWQKELYNQIIQKTSLRGNRSRPLRSANFAECRLTKMPAVLLECGYMDSRVDTPIILTDDFACKVAEGVALAIVKMAQLEAKEEVVLKPAEKPAAKKSNEQLASEVIKGLWGNGSTRKKKLKAAGYDYEAVQKIVNLRLKK